MFTLRNTTERNSNSSARCENTNIKTTDRQIVKNRASIIDEANSIQIVKLLKLFNIYIDQYSKKTTCPFHKNGNERSPSFYVYPETNSFHCFGCKISGRPTEFVSHKKNIDCIDSAIFILEEFGQYCDQDHVTSSKDGEIENNRITLEFSDYIRTLNKKYLYSEEIIKITESACYSFDKMNDKYDLTTEALESLVLKTKRRIEASLQ